VWAPAVLSPPGKVRVQYLRYPTAGKFVHGPPDDETSISLSGSIGDGAPHNFDENPVRGDPEHEGTPVSEPSLPLSVVVHID